MSLSLNEVEAMAKKATRGAGYPWGLAEEAGKAVRWLCAHGFDGCSHLARLLAIVDKSNLAQRLPDTSKTPWSAQDWLCPLASGACLTDDLAALSAGRRVVLGPVLSPLMLIPFAASASRAIGTGIQISCTEAVTGTDGEVVSNKGTWPTQTESIEIVCGSVHGPLATRCHRARPEKAAWDALAGFAARTYAPETAESRLKGAGAGLNDND